MIYSHKTGCSIQINADPALTQYLNDTTKLKNKGSNMGNSHRHAHIKVPVILLGGIDGKFQGNRHIVFPDYTERTSNMLLALAHKYGIEEFPKYNAAGREVGTQKNFGSSTTPLSL